MNSKELAHKEMRKMLTQTSEQIFPCLVNITWGTIQDKGNLFIKGNTISCMTEKVDGMFEFIVLEKDLTDVDNEEIKEGLIKFTVKNSDGDMDTFITQISAQDGMSLYRHIHPVDPQPVKKVDPQPVKKTILEEWSHTQNYSERAQTSFNSMNDILRGLKEGGLSIPEQQKLDKLVIELKNHWQNPDWKPPVDSEPVEAETVRKGLTWWFNRTGDSNCMWYINYNVVETGKTYDKQISFNMRHDINQRFTMTDMYNLISWMWKGSVETVLTNDKFQEALAMGLSDTIEITLNQLVQLYSNEGIHLNVSIARMELTRLCQTILTATNVMPENCEMFNFKMKGDLQKILN